MNETQALAPDDHILEEIERRRFDLNLGLLRIYNTYRVFVGLALLAVSAQSLFSTRLGQYDEVSFWWLTLAYTALNVVAAIFLQIISDRRITQDIVSLGVVLFDIIALCLLMYFSGGVASGMAALLLVTVATGAILLVGRYATLIAAVASISLLYEEFYLGLSFPSAEGDFFQAGIFGAIYFTTSLFIQRLSNRIRDNDIRALTQQAELANLERLNRLIIQRMRTGIIVVDSDGEVRMHNQSARLLVGVEQNQIFATIPAPLQNRLERWREDTSYRAAAFSVSEHSPVIRANFSAVRETDSQGDITIFLEDTSEVQQQAQQLKLAELGRLSASIAHEVRNPLGAISHAAQLLSESDVLEEADRRLSEIIISHCERMNGVVENVLEMSRRKNPEPQRLLLAECLAQFHTQMTEAFPESDIQVVVEPEDTLVRVDPANLVQALTNLVDNALRHSAENGKGQVAKLEAGIELSSDRPYLNVIDYGTGVAEENLPNLFQPFNTGRVGGTGLGLYITKELCDANQSQLSYYRHADGGSCFRILFTHPDRISL